MVRASAAAMGDEPVIAATGQPRAHWFALLDAHGAAQLSHTEIARWLVSEQGVDAWWAQHLTVAYEQARGRRQPGQLADGSFTVNVSKRVTAEPDAALDALCQAVETEWSVPLVSLNRAAKYPSARFNLPDGSHLLAGISPVQGGKITLTLTWNALADGDGLAERKARLQAVLTGVRAALAAGDAQ